MSTAEQLASTGGATQAQVTWSQKVTDFTFLLESGEELRCHKYVLVENSPVFDAMLTNAYEEAQKSQMSIGHFDKDTVIRFNFGSLKNHENTSTSRHFTFETKRDLWQYLLDHTHISRPRCL